MTTFTDEMLGLITVRTNARARRIIMRPQVDGVQVTVPPRTTERLLTDTLNHFRQRLRARQLEIQKVAEEKDAEKKPISKSRIFNFFY